MTDKPYRPQQDIVTLMQLFDQQVKESPELPDAETRLLRARLVFEEALEFVKGCGCTVNLAGANGAEQAAVIDKIAVELDPEREPDFVEYVDGCIDQLVVTYGALNAAGVQAQPAWDEVQRSNMSKAWPHCSLCDAVLERDFQPGAGPSPGRQRPRGRMAPGSEDSQARRRQGHQVADLLAREDTAGAG